MNNSSTSVLSAQGLVKSFAGRRVVDDVSLKVHCGEVVGLLGPNGAGKTTTFYMIAGAVSSQKGSIWLDDKNITRMPLHKRARLGLSYLPQEKSVFRKLSVENNLFAVLQGRGLSWAERKYRVDSIISEMGLEAVRYSMGYQLSGGECRRIEIARALVVNPKFLLLDEPFAGVDPISIVDIQNIIADIRNRNIGILITDHNVRETLGITDRAYVISIGKILTSGPPKVLINDERARQFYFGENFSI